MRGQLASWLLIRNGLTPHELRHSDRVWLDDLGTPAVLTHDRLGHSMPGIGGTYAHGSPLMRQRLALSPRSPVRILGELLTARAA
ncbi:hypothetical protein ACFOY4_00275 [Actinomadura syzygii]|uniref:Tyrosine-type recombinase/integrase n=1 Tax=Actinomadura syzygii TaxID=1427538 RepID=A0A5D0TTC1_9ACTN|nr:hypothetical protein [Actinomadura syzygii]TYC08079.1 hypothetical protein FXF65_40135 [Actinomadura syzygii]